MRSLMPGSLVALTLSLLAASAAHAQDGYRRCGPVPRDFRYSGGEAAFEDPRDERFRIGPREERFRSARGAECAPPVRVRQRYLGEVEGRCIERRVRVYRVEAPPVRRYAIREECPLRRPACDRAARPMPEPREERYVERYERPRAEEPRVTEEEREPTPRESVQDTYVAPKAPVQRTVVASAAPVHKVAAKPAKIVAVKKRVRKPAY